MAATHSTPRVLFIGQQPETVDFSDPALPPGFDAAKIHAGIAIGMQQMADRGWHADPCLVQPDASASEMVRQRLAATSYDCVVIGGGIRIPPKERNSFAAAAALDAIATGLDHAASFGFRWRS